MWHIRFICCSIIICVSFFCLAGDAASVQDSKFFAARAMMGGSVFEPLIRRCNDLRDSDIVERDGNVKAAILKCLSGRIGPIKYGQSVRTITKTSYGSVGQFEGTTTLGTHVTGDIMGTTSSTRTKVGPYNATVPPQFGQAFGDLQKLARRKHAVACAEVGACIFVEATSGWIGMSDRTALEYFKTASEYGVVDAMFMQAFCLYYGIGSPKNRPDVNQAYTILCQLADELSNDSSVSSITRGLIGSGWLARRLSEARQIGLSSCKVKKASATEAAISAFEHEEWLKGYKLAQKADQGNVDIQYYLGYIHLNGLGVVKDSEVAAKWFRRAAEQGDPMSQFMLSICYDWGDGVVKNLREAVKWCRKAAEKGYYRAQFCLGCYYYDGKGVVRDLVEAARWFRKAAEQGDSNAQYWLGCCYANGEGVTKNESEAVKWYRKAAEQGDAKAQNNLGCCYANGAGVAKNESEAVKWYRKAAEQGNVNAQYNLGVRYKDGEGVEVNKQEAIKWFRKAAAQGDEDAKKQLEQCNL